MLTRTIISILLLTSSNVFSQWYEVNSNVTETLTNIKFINDDIGYCIGLNGTIIKTIDGGENWTNISFSTQHFEQIYFLDTQTGFVTDDNTIYRTIDGTNFVDVSSNFSINNYNLTSIKISFKELFGIIKVGYVNTNDNTDAFYKTYKTFDFGNNWQEVNDDFTSGFYYIVDTDTYYFVSFDINKTTNGGVSWETIPNINFSFPPLQETFQIFPNNHGVATLMYTYAYAKFDLNENTSTEHEAEWFKSFDFIDNLGFYVEGHFGGNNSFYRSNDYGITLTEISNFDANYTFYNIDFINNDVGFVCGDNGKIFKITNASTLSIDDNLVAYKIKIFPIPASDFIEIKATQELEVKEVKIIDINGKLIKLYDNNLQKLNISDINNGMYFLKIKTNKGILTKKILIEK